VAGFILILVGGHFFSEDTSLTSWAQEEIIRRRALRDKTSAEKQ
jgi:hypothetical protein